MKFYAPYVLSGLTVFPEKNVSFWLSSHARPIIFESHNEDKQFKMLYLVMPVATTNSTQS
jgi:DNA polymerase III sliding clamp (beta) subunit (PCNA family)